MRPAIFPRADRRSRMAKKKVDRDGEHVYGGGALGVPLQGEPQLNYTSYSKCMGIRGYTLQ